MCDAAAGGRPLVPYSLVLTPSCGARSSIFFSFVPFWFKGVTKLEEAVRAMDARGELTVALERQVLGLELPGSIHWEPKPPSAASAAAAAAAAARL